MAAPTTAALCNDQTELCPSDSDKDTDAQESTDDETSQDGHKNNLTFISNVLRGSCHVAVAAEDHTPSDRKIEVDGVVWKTACSRKLSLPAGCYVMGNKPTPHFALCGLKACRNLL